jgi:hypothetical protein
MRRLLSSYFININHIVTQHATVQTGTDKTHKEAVVVAPVGKSLALIWEEEAGEGLAEGFKVLQE